MLASPRTEKPQDRPQTGLIIDAGFNPAHNSRHIAGDEVRLGLAKICLTDRLAVSELTLYS